MKWRLCFRITAKLEIRRDNTVHGKKRKIYDKLGSTVRKTLRRKRKRKDKKDRMVSRFIKF